MKNGRFESASEMMHAVANGKKIRCIYLNSNDMYIHLTDKGIVLQRIDSISSYALCCSDYYNYELYEEPKQKVKLYKYIYKDYENSEWYESSKYYKNDEHFNEDFCNENIYFKNLSSVIEVEE